MRRWLTLIGLALLAAPAAARTEPRVALIVGNSNYASPRLYLPNPVNDAVAMDRALRRAGFETVVLPDAKRLDLYRAVEQFRVRLAREPRTIGLFYYAGHGVQAAGVNYLIPADAVIESDGDLEANAFDMARVLAAMRSAQNELNIVILDACRDNPLRRTRGLSRGLAPMDAPTGTFIAYAAAPGQAAQDGTRGGNGVFTAELIRAMDQPGLPLEQMFKRVIAGVRADTHDQQQPWSEASVQGDFYFHEAVTPPSPAPAKLDAGGMEREFWASIRDSRRAQDFQAYLEKYPRGEFTPLAKNRLAELNRSPGPAAAATNDRPRASTADGSAAAPLAAAPASGASADRRRCESMTEQQQLGEPLNASDREYFKDHCR